MAFVWSMVLLLMLMYAFALFISQTVRIDVQDEGLSRDVRLFMYRYYGTASGAAWTMFEITFSGGWPNYVRRLVEEVHTAYVIPFALYVGLVVFAITRIITALFLKETMEKASEDVSMVLAEQKKKQEMYMHRLQDFFIAADESNDGYLSRQEFYSIMEFPEVQTYCNFLELKGSDIEQLFDALDVGNGKISYSEFCRGVLRVKGMARSLDLVTVMHDCQLLLKEVQALQKCVGCPSVLPRRGAAEPCPEAFSD
uniref:EF-hand domain-containing protein n=1 Tax=Zooxanthella nutricula TaxID=1333877 RepID=A0A7S2QGW3_9DINO|mmetsp:Transcript_90537/g.277264  ORF Transcript_90537/g.277264 Transcript_90537/m.277264 type:complete len:254 (+) Transcript_90537:3-764(+)